MADMRPTPVDPATGSPFLTVAAADAAFQPLDADLTAIAAVNSASAGVLVTDGAGWLRKTYAQLKAALGISTADVAGLGTIATHAAGEYVTAAAATTTYQPVDHTWAAGLAVLSGQIIEHSGTLYKATASFTLPGTFNTTNLTSVGGGGGAVQVDGTPISTLNILSTAVAASDVGAIANSLVTTKGDLIVATAASTPARKAVGTDGQVLTADAASTGGVKWSTPAGAASSPLPSWVTGRYYDGALVSAASGSGSAMATGQIYYMPIMVPHDVTVDRIGIWVSSGGAGNVRLGIYNDSAGLVGARLLDAGTVAISAASGGFEATISQALGAGNYWLAANFDTAVTAVIVDPTGAIGRGFSSLTSSADINRAWQTFAFGAMPASPTVGGYDRNSNLPSIRVRAV